LAHGVPIVTTQPRVALPEFSHGENVYLVPRQDPEALAMVIRRLARDPERRKVLAKGATLLSEEFRWERIASETLALYQGMGVDA
jgi:glycosyltransferase involved in cell wall biosynthesis